MRIAIFPLFFLFSPLFFSPQNALLNLPCFSSQYTNFEAVAFTNTQLSSQQSELNYIHTVQLHDSEAPSSSPFSFFLQHLAHTSVCVPIPNILLDSKCTYIHTYTHMRTHNRTLKHTTHCCLCVCLSLT